MNVWLIEPLDPLIARDGRPSAVGGRFTTTKLPFLLMVAGAVRTRMGSEEGAFTLPRHALAELKEKVLVRGPLLAELCSEEGTIRRVARAGAAGCHDSRHGRRRARGPPAAHSKGA